MSKLIRAVALLLLINCSAFAADLHCGRDTDRNGSVDNYCAGKDADFDGYDSVADGGTDCDDTNWQVYPGIPVATGCSAGQAKMCQSDGTFTSCAALGTAHCPSGTLAVYFVDDAETDCSGSGTSYADPENYRCWFNTGMSGYHALTPGDCIIWEGGTYTDSWGSSPTRMVYTDIDGTASNPITMLAAPGESVIVDSPGVSPNAIAPMQYEFADYINTIGFEIKPDFAHEGIHVDDSDYNKVLNNYVHDLDSDCGGPNCGGIKLEHSASYTTVRGNLVWNNYNRSNPTNDNNNQINVYRGIGNQILYNVFGDDVSGGSGNNFFWKHGDVSGDAQGVIRGNLFSGGHRSHFETAVGGLTIDRNIFINPNASGGTYTTAINIHGNGSGATYFQGAILIENNTVVDGFPLQIFGSEAFTEQTLSPFTVDTGTELFTNGDSTFTVTDLAKVMVESSGTLPAPLAVDTYYYIIYVSGTTYKLATSYANAVADTAINITTAGSGTHSVIADVGVVTARKNIFRDTKASAYSGDGTSGFFRLCHYCGDTAYEMVINNNKYAISANAHFNTASTALFYSLFGGAAGAEDLTYSTYADWIAAGIETGSVNADPALDADYIAQHASMADWGWRTANEVAGGGGGGGGGSSVGGGGRAIILNRRFRR